MERIAETTAEAVVAQDPVSRSCGSFMMPKIMSSSQAYSVASLVRGLVFFFFLLDWILFFFSLTGSRVRLGRRWRRCFGLRFARSSVRSCGRQEYKMRLLRGRLGPCRRM